MPPNPRRCWSAFYAGLLALVACSLHAQDELKPLPPVPVLPMGALTGQSIAVLPITLVVADPELESSTTYAPYKEHRPALLRFRPRKIRHGRRGQGQQRLSASP